MKQHKHILCAAFLFGLMLSLALPAFASGGSASDPLVTQSWVEQELERQFAPLEAELQQLRQEAYRRFGVNIVLTIGSRQAGVNGSSVTLDAAPRIEGAGYTMVPIRFIAESIGVSVEWLAETRQILFSDGTQSMLLTVGSTTAEIDGESYTMPCAPLIDAAGGRTLVHIRFVAEAFGCALDWEPKDGRTETVYVTK